MKRAYCSECGEYVMLDREGVCPGGHPRPCYRDITDFDVQPVLTETSGTVVPTSRRWVWAIAAIAGVILIGGAIAVAVLVWGAEDIGAPTQSDIPVASQSDTATISGAAPQPVEIESAEPAVVEPNPIQPNADGSYPPILATDTPYTPPTVEQQRWALATCAILTQVNGERHDLLGGCEPTPENVRICNEGLENWWGVSSREDLLATLSWIEKGGHRQGFDSVAYALSIPGGVDELRELAGDDQESNNQIDIAQVWADRLGSASISGWDYSRYVFLCRRGYLGGYLTEEEAWQLIMPASELLHANFSSWKDLGENYLVGRKFWSLEQTGNSGAKYDQAQRELLTDPESPWVQLDWTP